MVTIADETVERLESLEPRSTEEFYQVGVANELLQQRDELLEVLRASGAAVLDSPADQIATETIKPISISNKECGSKSQVQSAAWREHDQLVQLPGSSPLKFATLVADVWLTAHAKLVNLRERQ